MKHPNRDELAPFVFGETSPATTRELNSHLRECAECRAQVEACHPRMAEFLRLKRQMDPHEIFQSDWYRHYKRMFADRL